MPLPVGPRAKRRRRLSSVPYTEVTVNASDDVQVRVRNLFHPERWTVLGRFPSGTEALSAASTYWDKLHMPANLFLYIKGDKVELRQFGEPGQDN